jgi:signal transduction histidine kinase
MNINVTYTRSSGLKTAPYVISNSVNMPRANMRNWLPTYLPTIQNKRDGQFQVRSFERDTRDSTDDEKRIRADERLRIMRDIHDGVGGQLIAILGASKLNQLDSKSLTSMLEDALVDLRVFIDLLSPKDFDLITTLANLRFRLQERLKASGLGSEWSFDDRLANVQVDSEALVHIQRIIAEALTNVSKHATGATRVSVSVRWDANSSCLQVEISDDGCGISSPPTGRQSYGRGLSNMQTRVNLVGGTLELVYGACQRGLLVRVRVPGSALLNQGERPLAIFNECAADTQIPAAQF